MRPRVRAGACVTSVLLLALAAAPVRGDTSKTVDEFLTRAQPFGFSGSILIARRGRIMLAKGYGWADRDHAVPYSERTVLSIGSITKQFTAAAILKLEMGGHLKTSDPDGGDR